MFTMSLRLTFKEIYERVNLANNVFYCNPKLYLIPFYVMAGHMALTSSLLINWLPQDFEFCMQKTVLNFFVFIAKRFVFFAKLVIQKLYIHQLV